MGHPGSPAVAKRTHPCCNSQETAEISGVGRSLKRCRSEGDQPPHHDAEQPEFVASVADDELDSACTAAGQRLPGQARAQEIGKRTLGPLLQAD